MGGLLVSLSVSMGAQTSADGTVVYIGLWNKIHAIGNLAFTLMYPILSGFIAFSIAGRATLAPAMIGAMVATDGEILGTEGGTGIYRLYYCRLSCWLSCEMDEQLESC